MRRVKKTLSLLILVCMLCPCISMVVHAASAELRFSDPSTTVGAEVDVVVKVYSSADIKSLDVTLAYETDKLRFISGTNASGGNGSITLTGEGNALTEGYQLKFQALAEGTGKITVSQSSGTDSDGSPLNMTNGNSAVKIGPGDPSLIQPEQGAAVGPSAADGPQVDVDGVQYLVTNLFSDVLIPQGFSRTEMSLEGVACQVITQPVSGISAFYLTPAAGGEAEFFLYNAEQGNFIPFELVSISQERYLVLLRDDGSAKPPKEYQETRFTFNGKEFTAWQNVDRADYYLVYALNADGQKCLYQYDTIDSTYQRFEQQTVAEAAPEKKTLPKGPWGKVLGLIEEFLDIAVIIAAMLLLVLIVTLIVVGVKLYHRNVELDDLYDEYGIDMEDEPSHQKARKQPEAKEKKAPANRKKEEPAVRVPVKTMSMKEEDLFEDYDEFDEEEEPDGYDSDSYDDYDEDDHDGDPYDDDYDDDDDDDDSGYDDYDDDDDDDDDGDYGFGREPAAIDDLDALLSRQSQRKRGKSEQEKAFKVDFVDLD